MAASLRIYIQGDTPIHRADARVKLVLLLLFSVGVFFVDTWRGLGIYSLMVAAVVVAGRMPLARLGTLSLPLVVLLAFIWVCNAFAFDVGSLAESGLGGVSAGFAEGWQPLRWPVRLGSCRKDACLPCSTRFASFLSCGRASLFRLPLPPKR